MKIRLAFALMLIFATGPIDAAEKLKGTTATVKEPTVTRQLTTKPLTGGVKSPTVVGVAELSDSDCINLQCELKIMTACATRVGCSCKGTGVTICVDTIDPD